MPEAIAILVDLVLVLAWVFAWGCLMGYRTSLKKILLAVAGLFNHKISIGPVGGRPLGFIADALVTVADAIDTALASLVLVTEKGAILLLHALAQQAKYLGQVLAELGETVEGKFRWWMALFPPAAALWAAVKAYQNIASIVHSLTAPAKHTVKVVETQVEVLDKHARGELATLEGQVEALGQRVESIARAGTTKVIEKAGAAASAVEQPVATTFPRIGNITDDLAWIRSKVRQFSRTLSVAGIVAIIGATIFKEFRLGWLRCPSVGKIGRGICGAEGLLTTIFADAITAFAITDMCRFAGGITAAAEGIRPLMLGFVDFENALIHCPSADYPKDIPHFLSSPTPVYGAIALG